MKVGDQVVCIERGKTVCLFGGTYTVEKIDGAGVAGGKKGTWDSAIIHLEGVDTGYFDWRFAPLDEMQNTNFISLVQGERQCK